VKRSTIVTVLWIALAAIGWLYFARGYEYEVDSASDCPGQWEGKPVVFTTVDGPHCSIEVCGKTSSWEGTELDCGWRHLPIGRRSGLPSWVGWVVVGVAAFGFLTTREWATRE